MQELEGRSDIRTVERLVHLSAVTLGASICAVPPAVSLYQALLLLQLRDEKIAEATQPRGGALADIGQHPPGRTGFDITRRDAVHFAVGSAGTEVQRAMPIPSRAIASVTGSELIR